MQNTPKRHSKKHQKSMKKRSKKEWKFRLRNSSQFSLKRAPKTKPIGVPKSSNFRAPPQDSPRRCQMGAKRLPWGLGGSQKGPQRDPKGHQRTPKSHPDPSYIWGFPHNSPTALKMRSLSPVCFHSPPENTLPPKARSGYIAAGN